MSRLSDILLFLLWIWFLILLPLVMLLRGAFYLGHLGPWLALVASASVTLLVLVLYATVVRAWLGFNLTIKALRAKTIVSGILLFTYLSYALIYIPEVNVKTGNERVEYTALHPFLRIAVGTWILVDSDLLVTDIARNHGELPETSSVRSLHHRQADGYVHAIDLRTIGRMEIRNRLMEIYFRLMGFNTLRHEGTADHLHASVPAGL